MADRVLVLDDSRAARQFLCRVLRQGLPGDTEIAEADGVGVARRLLGLDVGDDGPAARDAAGFALVVLEPATTDGAGAHLLAELASIAVRKIVATVHGDDEHLRAALRLGIDGYMLKQDSQDVWIDALKRLDHGQPALSPAVVRRLMQCFATLGPGTSASDGDVAPPPLIPAPPHLGHLTARESEVLTYLSKGFTIREISELLGIRWFTVNDHIKAIYRKLEVSSRAEAAVLAAKQGLV